MRMLKPLVIGAMSITMLAPAKAETMDKVLKEQREKDQTALRDLSLTPREVKPDRFGVTVLFQIENKSVRKGLWDCIAFLNSEPVKKEQIIQHHIPANGHVFAEESFSFHDYDKSATKIDLSAFSFKCRLIAASVEE